MHFLGHPIPVIGYWIKAEVFLILGAFGVLGVSNCLDESIGLWIFGRVFNDTSCMA